MDVGAIFLLLIVLAGVALFVFSPFRRQNPLQGEAGQGVSELLAERDRVLKEIQELDFDNALGKIPAEEYSAQRKMLLAAGADVLRRLDEQAASRQTAAAIGGSGATAALQAAITAPVKEISDDDLEELIAQRRSDRKEKTGGFCPKCGKPFLQSDKFCSCCGSPVGVNA